MTARFTHCREPDWFGGGGIERKPGPNPRAATWPVYTNTPAGSVGVPSQQRFRQADSIIGAINRSNGGVLVSTDNGRSWAEQTVGSPTEITRCLITEGSDLLVFCENYCYRGPNWLPVNTTKFYIANPPVFMNYYADASEGGGVIVLNLGSGLILRSTDGGVTWAQVTWPYAQLQAIGSFMLYDGAQFLALTTSPTAGQVALITSPNGEIWTAHDFTTSVSQSGTLSMDYAARMYAVANAQDLWLGSTVAELVAAAPIVPIAKNIESVAVLDDGRIVLQASDGTLYFSVDGGGSWTQDSVTWPNFSSSAFGPVTRLNGVSAIAGELQTTNNGAFAVRPVYC